MTTEEAQPRVLVLGTRMRARAVVSYLWDALPSSLNVADFDIVILDLDAFDRDRALADRTDMSRLPEAPQFARLMFSDGSAIVAIGDPSREIVKMQEHPMGGARRVMTSLDWWLPVSLPTQRVKGSVVRASDNGWAFWFEKLRSYDWHFVGSPKTKQWQRAYTTGRGDMVAAKSTPLAETRTGDPLGVYLEVFVGNVGAGKVVASSNSVVWLPPIPDLDPEEAITLVLREAFEIGLEAVTPEWAEEFKLPQEEEALAAVGERGTELQAAVDAFKSANEAAKREGRFRGLLFEQGEEVLEPLVWDALRELGATVTPPERAGIEDGRFVDPQGRLGMLEIKGRATPLPLRDVRQLDGWLRQALAEEEWEGKGLVVANALMSTPPPKRKDPVAPNALTFARNARICILTTPQLFRALAEHQAGSLAQAAFWDKIFETDGLVDLPGPRS